MGTFPVAEKEFEEEVRRKKRTVVSYRAPHNIYECVLVPRNCERKKVLADIIKDLERRSSQIIQVILKSSD